MSPKLWGRHQAGEGQRHITAPNPSRIHLGDVLRCAPPGAALVPWKPKQASSMQQNAAPRSLLEPDMWVGQMLKPPDIQHSFPLKVFMMRFPGPGKLLDRAAQGRRGRPVDMERWHSLHQLVSLPVQLSGPGSPTGSARDGDLLLVPQPWIPAGCLAQDRCCTLSPFCPSPGEAAPAFLSASGHLSHSPPSWAQV